MQKCFLTFWSILSKCTFLWLQHFFSPSTYPVNSVLLVVIWKYDTNFLMKHFIFFVAVASITEIVSFSHFLNNHCWGCYSFSTIMQHINPKYPWKNSQTEINQEKLLQICIFCHIVKDPDPSNRAKMQQELLFWFLTNICRIIEWIWFA